MRSKILLIAGVGVLTAVASGAAYKSITGHCPLGALVHTLFPSCAQKCSDAPCESKPVSCGYTSCGDATTQAPEMPPAPEAEVLATSQPAK